MGGRFKNRNWNLGDDSKQIESTEYVTFALLMDIRDELQRMNAILHCSNFIQLPHTLKIIEKNTRKRVYKKKI